MELSDGERDLLQERQDEERATYWDEIESAHDDALAEDERRTLAEVRERAIDLAVNDCQMWDNLPPSARDFYRAEARAELADE